MRTGIVLTITALLILSGAGGCLNMGAGNSPETRYFLIEANPEDIPQWTREKPMDPIAIGIGPVKVPRYLDRPQFLIRVNDQELLADEFNHWAEPLKVNIPRVMGENLSSLIGGSHIRVFPWNPSTPIIFQVSIDIHRFDADAAGKVVLKSTWRIMSVKDRQLLRERQSRIERASTGAAVGDRVEGMRLALSDLSLEIAGNLMEVQSRLDRTP